MGASHTHRPRNPPQTSRGSAAIHFPRFTGEDQRPRGEYKTGGCSDIEFVGRRKTFPPELNPLAAKTVGQRPPDPTGSRTGVILLAHRHEGGPGDVRSSGCLCVGRVAVGVLGLRWSNPSRKPVSTAGVAHSTPQCALRGEANVEGIASGVSNRRVRAPVGQDPNTLHRSLAMELRRQWASPAGCRGQLRRCHIGKERPIRGAWIRA